MYKRQLTDGHCFIVPNAHSPCATMLDEDVWREMQDFRKALVKMFLKEDQDCVFFETAMGLKYHPHMLLECVPVPRESGDMAPMYFQKAIQECESEWAHNTKLIKLGEKNVRRAVPKGLPYFHVDFGMEDGFAHVVEDEKEFAKNFAQGETKKKKPCALNDSPRDHSSQFPQNNLYIISLEYGSCLI